MGRTYYIDRDGNKHLLKWPIEAVLDLWSPLAEDNYPKDLKEREKEIERRYGLGVDDGYEVDE